MNNKDIITFAITAGQIMLENGAETYRVEDTMMHIAQHFNIEADVFATTTGVFISDGDITQIRRITHRTIHLGKVAKVNDISRKLSNNHLTFEEAQTILSDIMSLPPYSNIVNIIVTGICCFSFTYIFGGSFADCFNSLFTGLLLSLWLILLLRLKVSSFMTTLLGGVSVALSSLVFYNIGIGNNVDNIIIGSIMPLVPGMGLTNAIRDILEGDYLSGSGRIFDALMIAIALAVGIGFILKIWFFIFGGIAV